MKINTKTSQWANSFYWSQTEAEGVIGNLTNMYLTHSFILLLQITMSLGEMRRTIKVEKYPFPRGGDPAARYILEAGDQKEVTVCLKFRTFAYNEGFGCPFAMTTECNEGPENKSCVDWFTWHYCIGWKTGMEDDGKQAGHTEIYFSHDNQTAQEQSIQMAEKTRWHFNLYEDWLDLFEWQSACYAVSVIKRKELLYVNGKFIQGYEWPKKFRKGWGDYPLLLKVMGGWRGELTDLNIYDSAFEKEEMISWTTSCETPAEGEILSWKPEIYNLTNNNDTETVISEVSTDDLCLNREETVLEIFDNGLGKSPAMSEDTCARLNGQLNLYPVNEEKALAMAKEYEEYLVKVNISWVGLWVAGRSDIEGTEFVKSKEGYQFYPKGGKWIVKDPYTGDSLGTPFGLQRATQTYAKPTQECISCTHGIHGYTSEKNVSSFCANNIHSFCGARISSFCNPQKCERSDIDWGLICKFQRKLRLRLKGLCKETKVDTNYLLLGYEVLEQGGKHRRKYGGSTGWVLSYDKEQDAWQFNHQHYSQLTLTMEDKDALPVGIHSWVVANDTCSLGQMARLVVQSGFVVILNTP